MFYTVFVGNSLNTLGISTTKIDTNLVYSGSVWWEPLGDLRASRPYRTAFSDFEFHESPVVRLGTWMTGAREDRFSSANAAQNNPENLALYNSDGVPFFSTGSLAPGVTVKLANYYMWAQDYGLKYRGLAINGQHYLRWLNDFWADGPLPVSRTFDYGFEASVGYFICPKLLELYGRTSFVFGEFGNSNEYAFGLQLPPVEEPEPPGDRRGGPGAETAGRGDHHPLHGRHEPAGTSCSRPSCTSDHPSATDPPRDSAARDTTVRVTRPRWPR